MITASRTALASLCSWAFRPDVSLPRGESSAAAALGTEVHAAIECAIKGEPVLRASSDAGELYGAWLHGWWRDSGRDAWRAEVAYVLDPIAGTARESGAESRGYTTDHATIPGTADAVRIEGRTGYVIDWKTGREAPPARDNAQLLTLALAMRLAHGLDEVHASIVHVRPDSVSVDPVTFDAFDLDAWQLTLADLVRALPTAEAKPGPHCRALYCPAHGLCPATSHALAEVQPHRLRVVTNAADIESPEHAGALLGLVRMAEARASAIKAAVRDWADKHGGVPLDGGRVWRRVDTHREAIDLSVPGAVEAMRAVLGGHADTAIELSTTKAAIGNAARSFAAETGQPIAHVTRDTLNALRDVGATRQTKSTSYLERDAK